MHLKKFLGVVLLSAFTMSSVQAREFRSADVHSLDNPTALTIKKISEIISQKTGGKYKVKVFANSVLGSESETIELVKAGSLDMVRVNRAAFHDIVPEAMIPSFPFLFRDIKHFRTTMNGVQGDKILAAFDKAGFIGLALWESAPRSFYSKKPIKNMAGIKGLKIRVPQSEPWTSMAQAMGASPSSMTDVYSALKTGTVDAAENDYLVYESTRHYEVAPTYSETQHIITPEVLLFSKKVWSTLTREEQKLIRDAAKETVPYYADLLSKKEQAAKELAKKNGVTIVEDVNKTEFAAAMKPAWDKFTPTPELKALVQEIVKTE